MDTITTARMKLSWPSLKIPTSKIEGSSRAITIQMAPVVTFDRNTLRTAIMAFPSHGPGGGGLEQSLGPQRQGHQHQDDPGQDVVLGSPVEVPELLPDTQQQTPGDGAADASEAADGEGQEPLEGEGQADRRIGEGDGGDGVPGETGNEAAQGERHPAGGDGV